MLVSVVIDNYNSAGFVAAAVDGALAQTCPSVEVIVVDDGSTDDSWPVIERFGERILALRKRNGGQSSALNAGFRACRGDLVVFLDGDDVLFPTAVERAAELARDPSVAKVHWPLIEIDGGGRPTGETIGGELAEGDLRDAILADGPDSYASPPTSGNAWSRRFLEQVMPLPEAEPLLGVGSASPDEHLSMMAPLFGRVARIREPQGAYRVHEHNFYASLGFEARLEHDAKLHRFHCDALADRCRQLGLEADPERWVRESWYRALALAASEISRHLPAGEPFALIDRGDWGMSDSRDLRPVGFLLADDPYAGDPDGSASAIAALDRHVASGTRFLVLGWPAYWWLEEYPEFARRLRSRHACVFESERVQIYALSGHASPSHGAEIGHLI